MNSSVCSSSSDDAFGPQVQDCRGGLDFTLRFEHVIFTIVPASAFLVAVPLRLLHLLARPIVVSGRATSSRQILKVVRNIASASLSSTAEGSSQSFSASVAYS
jgi:ATP-binding cassette subfamily C (CFTR/MRP) protein 1